MSDIHRKYIPNTLHFILRAGNKNDSIRCDAFPFPSFEFPPSLAVYRYQLASQPISGRTAHFEAKFR